MNPKNIHKNLKAPNTGNGDNGKVFVDFSFKKNLIKKKKEKTVPLSAYFEIIKSDFLNQVT